ncbi:S-layer protein [Candidatus Woesearchaeota archaeon]|nr:S-layer protein [Candidatus Woesearchaeota archaeon]
MKKSIKKVFALGVSVALLATTMVGALADLSKYPAPFVDDNGVFNGAIVVGANAATSDVLGAIDIAASLQAEAKRAVSVGDNSVVVEGGKDYDNLYLNNTWPNADVELKENHLDGFVDSDFDVDGDTVDYHDEIVFFANQTMINPAQNEDAAGKDYVTVAKNGIEYRVYFEDAEVLNADATHTAEFKFLGQNVEAYNFDFSEGIGSGSFTVISSVEKSMIEGDEVNVAGHTVKLVRVGSTSVIVDVDGQTKVINDDGNSQSFDEADDFQVEVDSLFYIEGASDNIANLKLGADLEETATDGQPAEMFGQPDDDAEADWVWAVGNESGNRYVGLRLNKDYDTLDINTPAEEKAPLFLGDEVVLPNDYAALQFASLAANYEDVKISLDDSYFLDDGESAPNDEGTYKVVKFEADSDIFTVGTETAETVYVAYNSTDNTLSGIWYEDAGDEIKVVISSFDILIDAELVRVTPSADLDGAGNNTFTIVAPGDEALTVEIYNAGDDAFDYFGTQDDSDAEDIKYGGTSLGTKEWDYQTDYGIKLADPDSQFGSGASFIISVPSEREYATLVVKSKGSSVAAAATGSAYMVNPIEVGLGMLDSEATLGSKPMIVVGGPYVNSVAKELLGFPTDEEIAQTFTDGKAMIKWFDDEQAMLVAGWSAQDTRGASYVVADYSDYDFEGSELEVVVTDLKNIDVMAK